MIDSRTQRITVIGAGLMGHGIALEFAMAGYRVSLHDRTQAIIDQAVGNIRSSAERLAALGRLGADQIAPALELVAASADLGEAVRGARLVVEAISEDLGAKHALFSMLNNLCDPETIFASNTSSFMPSRLAEAVIRSERLVVAHYFNPPYLLPLVEIVPGPETSEQTVSTMVQLLESVGKKPVVLRKEATGFVGNRLQFALFREALSIVERGIASPEAVDQVVRFGFGRRLAAAGPFEVFDLGGLDTIMAVAAQIFPELASANSDTGAIPDSLRLKIERGQLGVKSGQGFHTWTPERADELRTRLSRALSRAEDSMERNCPGPPATMASRDDAPVS